ncbi:MAG: rod shape-determining protein MreD [Candidatus Omnitrophica bacterium]|nr:rod shape-determining protein MreD [Candidatus Omnitrophota bacterium]
MRHWLFLLLILVIAILQSSVIDAFRVFNVKPDLLFSIVVIVSLLLEFRQAIIFSLASGIFKDLLGANHIAINTFLFPVWSFLIMQAARSISLEGDSRQAIFVFIAVALNALVGRIIFFSATLQIAPGIFIRTLLFESIYTALFTQWIFIFASSRFSLSETLKDDPGPDLESEIE